MLQIDQRIQDSLCEQLASGQLPAEEFQTRQRCLAAWQALSRFLLMSAFPDLKETRSEGETTDMIETVFDGFVAIAEAKALYMQYAPEIRTDYRIITEHRAELAEAFKGL